MVVRLSGPTIDDYINCSARFDGCPAHLNGERSGHDQGRAEAFRTRRVWLTLCPLGVFGSVASMALSLSTWHVLSAGAAPLPASWSAGVGVAPPWRDGGGTTSFEGSRRREAPHSQHDAIQVCAQLPRPRSAHIAPHARLRTPTVSPGAPCKALPLKLPLLLAQVRHALWRVDFEGRQQARPEPAPAPPPIALQPPLAAPTATPSSLALLGVPPPPLQPPSPR